MTGNYMKCHQNGKAAESKVNRRCFHHKLAGQVHRGERYRNFKKQNSGIAKKNNRRVGAWGLYDPESEVRVKTEKEGEEY
jgi:hypothetical protein